MTTRQLEQMVKHASRDIFRIRQFMLAIKGRPEELRCYLWGYKGDYVTVVHAGDGTFPWSLDAKREQIKFSDIERFGIYSFFGSFRQQSIELKDTVPIIQDLISAYVEKMKEETGAL